jgi:preprotein translocase subunit SecE
MANTTEKMGLRKDPQPAGSIPLPKAKRGLKSFFTDVVRELKKVTWPTRKETNRMTGVVLAICALIVGILTLMNIVVDTVLRILNSGKF